MVDSTWTIYQCSISLMETHRVCPELFSHLPCSPCIRSAPTCDGEAARGTSDGPSDATGNEQESKQVCGSQSGDSQPRLGDNLQPPQSRQDILLHVRRKGLVRVQLTWNTEVTGEVKPGVLLKVRAPLTLPRVPDRMSFVASFLTEAKKVFSENLCRPSSHRYLNTTWTHR